MYFFVLKKILRSAGGGDLIAFVEVMGMLGIEFRIWNSNLPHYFETFPSMFVKESHK